jgi:hypothetical protein
LGAETQAAYRLFDQAREEKRGLGWEEVLAPHMARTETRMAEHPVVLCLQDTTELDFNGQDMDGLGRLSYEAQRGMYLHPTYVVTPQRLPLGIVDAWMWARPLEVSESQRWIEGYARLAERAGHLPATRLVYVADREADILELMQRAHTLGHPADYLLRAQHNRCLPQGGKLWPAVLAATPLGDIEFTLPERLNRPARAVRQTLHVRPVDLPDGQGGMMPVTCLIARETGVPEGQKAVEWRLLTNRVVATLEEAAQLIDWYRCRWEIETLFHVLKNGCRVESLQLGHVRKLELALAISRSSPASASFPIVPCSKCRPPAAGRPYPDDQSLCWRSSPCRLSFVTNSSCASLCFGSRWIIVLRVEVDHGLGLFVAFTDLDGAGQIGLEDRKSFGNQFLNQLLGQAGTGLELVHHDTFDFQITVVIGTDLLDVFHQCIEGAA